MRYFITMLLALAAPALLAQEYRATLSGRISDPQGLGVARAKIEVTSVETGALYRTVSEPTGQYVVPLLPPAVYEISAEAPGFKQFRRTQVRLGSGERVVIDIALEIGATSESITITGEAPLLQTATANTGQVLTTRQVENLPMNGRTPLVLAQLANGVVPPNQGGFTRPFDNAGASNFSMGGGPLGSNEVLLDGAPNASKDGRMAYSPPVDSVQELKVDTFQSDASFGNTVGGVANVVMKSGTNELHGSAYWFNQVSATAASGFFANANNQPKPISRFNQYGGSAGGPVVIPKVLDGRQKLFFFFTYEGLKDAYPRLAVITVPTEANRRGDFSQQLAVGPSYQLYDPNSAVLQGSRISRQPFAGNIIPTARLNAAAVELQKLYPLPNLAGRADGLLNFQSNLTGERNSFQNYLIRGDYNISVRQKLALNYRYSARDSMGANELGCFPQEPCGSANGRTRVNHGATIDHVSTLTPRLLLNTRVNFTRFVQGRTNFTEGYDLSRLGWPKSLTDQLAMSLSPRVEFNNYFRLGDGGSNRNPQDSFQLFTTLNQIRGSHSLKVGADLRLHRDNINIFDWPSGRFFARPDWTRGPLDNSPTAPLGQDYASYLLGLPSSGQIDLNAGRNAQSKYSALFVQDDWRVNQSLTLNLGLRWEADWATTERFNRAINGFAFDASSPIEAQARAAYAARPIPEIRVEDFRVTGGLTFTDSANRAAFRTRKNYFAPRLGFAWQPRALGPKTVLRGGFGVFYDSFGLAPGIVQTGFFQSTPYVATLDNYLTPASTFSNPFPSGLIPSPGASAGLATNLGQAVTFFEADPKNPYSLKWNFNVQRELGWGTVLEAGYTGNRVNHIGINQALSFVPRPFLSASPVRDQAVISNLTATVPNPFAGLIPGTTLNGNTIARRLLLAAHPHFSGVTVTQRPDASSYFHAFSLRLEKRLSDGVQVLVNYQYSRLMERTTRLNDFDAPELRVSDIDRPHRLVVSGNYEFPWLKGPQKGAARVAGWFAGGWMVTGIYVAQSGSPLVWGNVLYLGGDLNVQPRNLSAAFDTTRFNRVPAQQLEYNVRSFPSRFNNHRTDGINNFDLSMLKNFPIREKATVQLRFESFNSLNRVQFGSPNVAPTSSAFGVITGQANQPRRLQTGLRILW